MNSVSTWGADKSIDRPTYISITRRQSDSQWSGDIVAQPAPKYSECKNLLEKIWPLFLGIKTASSPLIIFQSARLPTPSIARPCWCNLNILKAKHRGKITKKFLILHDNDPAYRALATKKKQAYLGFQCIDHPPYSPSGYGLFLGLKNKRKFAIFLPTRRSILPRKPGWTDNGQNFFELLAKVITSV